MSFMWAHVGSFPLLLGFAVELNPAHTAHTVMMPPEGGDNTPCKTLYLQCSKFPEKPWTSTYAVANKNGLPCLCICGRHRINKGVFRFVMALRTLVQSVLHTLPGENAIEAEAFSNNAIPDNQILFTVALYYFAAQPS